MKLKIVLLSILPLLFCAESFAQAIVINEIMASNNLTLTDEDGDSEDWIELFNTSNSSINLSAFYLSDDSTDLTKWQMPSTMMLPQGHAIVFASGKDRDFPEMHTNFGISSGGEELYLSDQNGILQTVPATILGTDEALALTVDGGSSWAVTADPTPETSNQITLVPNLTFSHEGGFYENSIDVVMTSTIPGSSIHYTLDGSIPDETDPVYTDAISMGELLNQPATLATQQSAVGWVSPVSTIDKINTLRAVIYHNGQALTPVETNSYLIGDVSEVGMPIASINVEANCLFDTDTGFYIPGPNPGNPSWYYTGNFHTQNREVPAHVEFFEPDGEVAIDQRAALKLHGGLTKTYSQKSLKLIARSEFGEGEFRHKFFEDSDLDEFDRIILRNTGQDYNRAMMRDAVINDLADGLDLERQHTRPTIVFLNGEYWGIHNLREKIDEHHLENLYGLDKDSIDFLQVNGYVEEGSDDDYDAFYDYVMNQDLSDNATFQWVEEQADLENFADYFITQMYFNNREWPHNNIKFWKYQGDGGQWRWILFDTDVTAGAWPPTNANNSAYDWMADTNGYPVWSRGPWLHMLTNQDYKHYYINRSADLQNTKFTEQSCHDMIDMHKQRYMPQIANHIARWQHIPTVPTWETRVSTFSLFCSQRPDDYFDHTVAYFGLSGSSNLTVDQNIAGAGSIQLSTLHHTSFPWTGEYYHDVPINLEAIPAEGYTFSHWQETGETDPSIEVVITGNTTYTAVYSLSAPLVSGIAINELVASNINGIVDTAGSTEDWFELYNNSGSTVNVNGLYITDDLGDKDKWKIEPADPSETEMAPGDFLFFWADNDPEEGWNHTNFKLSSSGESIYLYQLLGNDTLLIDAVIFNDQEPDISYGRYPDGSWMLDQMIFTTPGASNIQQTMNPDLHINEILAKNVNDLIDDQGNNSDWIEIYNAGTEDTELAGYFLSDDPTDLTQFRIPLLDPTPTLVPAGGFMIMYADDDSLNLPGHLPFKFSSAGESVTLSFVQNGDTTIVDELTFGQQEEDISFGCYPDGSSNLEIMNTTTPEASNVQNITSIESLESNGITVFPNPFQNGITIKFEEPAHNQMQVALYGSDGRLMIQHPISDGATEYRLITDRFAAGLYNLRLTDLSGKTQPRSFNLIKN